MKRCMINAEALRAARSLGLFAMLLVITNNLYAQKPTAPPPSYDLEGGHIIHMGKLTSPDPVAGFTNENIRHMAISVGQLSGVDPQTGGIITNTFELVSLVSRELDVTGEAYFYTNLYISGDVQAYGLIKGDGSGITNISTSTLIGKITERPELRSALEDKLDAEGVWSAITNNMLNTASLQSSVTGLQDSNADLLSEIISLHATDLSLQSSVTGLQSSVISLQSSDESLQTAINDLETGAADTNNPHQVTSAQVGSYTILETDSLLSNTLAQVQNSGYLAVTESGDLTIDGVFIASNVTAQTFTGDGSGLSNLNLNALSGSLTNRPEIMELQTADTELQTSVSSIQSSVSNLLSSDISLQSSVTGLQSSDERLQSDISVLSNIVLQIIDTEYISVNQHGNIAFDGEIEATELKANQQLIVEGAASFYTNIQVRGDARVTGRIYGDGAGLTNLAVSALSGSFTNRPEIIELQTADTELQTSISSIQSSVTGLQSSVSNLQSSDISLLTSVTGLQTSNIQLQTSVTNLETAVTALQSVDAELQTSITTLQGSNAALLSEVIDLHATDSELQTSVALLQTSSTDTNNPHQVTAAQVGAYTEEEADALLGEAVSGINVQITEIQTKVEALDNASTDTNNPHMVTAAQVGSYTASEVDTLVSNQLGLVYTQGFVSTNETGDLDIVGTFSASNMTAQVFHGDGSGLTNLHIDAISGTLTNRPEIQELQTADISLLSSVTGLQSSVSNLQSSDVSLLTSVTALQSSVTGLQSSVISLQSSDTVLQTTVTDLELVLADLQTGFMTMDESSSDTNNPHYVTAEQVGAYSTAESDLILSNSISQIHERGYVATNETGDLTIAGSFSASNVLAQTFQGDGSALTNLNINALSGSLTNRPEIIALQSSDISLLSSVSDLHSSVSNLLTSDVSLQSSVVDLQSTVVSLQSSDESLQTAITQLETAAADTNNPHQVTAEQIEALPLTGGTMTGHIDMAMSQRLINLPEPANDNEAVTKSYLDKRLSFIIPQGDLSMGIYTNFPGY